MNGICRNCGEKRLLNKREVLTRYTIRCLSCGGVVDKDKNKVVGSTQMTKYRRVGYSGSNRAKRQNKETGTHGAN